MPIQATASRGMLSTRTARRAHMTELTRVGLTCRAFARAGSKGGSHDRAHTGAGSHAWHSYRLVPNSPRTVSGRVQPGCMVSRQHWMVCGPSRQLRTALDGSGQFQTAPDGTGRVWTVIWTALDGIRMSLHGMTGWYQEAGWLWTVSGWYPDGIRTVSGRYPDGIRTVSGRHRKALDGIRTVSGWSPDGSGQYPDGIWTALNGIRTVPDGIAMQTQ